MPFPDQKARVFNRTNIKAATVSKGMARQKFIQVTFFQLSFE